MNERRELADHELFETPPENFGVQLIGQCMGKGVGHAGIKKIVPWMGDQSPSFTFCPCGKVKDQKCVFENLVVLLNCLDRYWTLSCNIVEIDGFAVICCGNIQKLSKENSFLFS